ncbi:DUF1329 domain-containing protein [Pseudomonas borbori]|uniref:DUF1329 domain-containing protein n=1 Tax=Pseudomonas borbori TaxID=289003 RepID=A0A1I5XB45_9PSED|nr:DUF1329 domain-containing protein [Pseudomonas borbori]SFQ29198.1 Protein of unknown function [Pseudomonas borbori]
MLVSKITVALSVGLICVASASAAVSPEEAKQLGSSLTWLGAETSGNAEGTIPAYTGGLTTPPANYDPATPGKRPSPFPDEVPLYSIDQSNMEDYKDKLTEGTKELMRRYKTFRIDVYPTRRTAAVPEHVMQKTIANATQCESTQGGLGITGEKCAGGYPFPIPKSGYEVMWNALLAFQGHATKLKQQSYAVDSTGRAVMAGGVQAIQQYPYYDRNIENPRDYFKLWYKVDEPARIAGEQIMLIDAVNPMQFPRQAFQYLPGQRRVKRAPELSYDTPNPNTGGGNTFDDIKLFTGAMDKFEFKTVGKREVFIPYNTYVTTDPERCPVDKLLMPNHQNPDCVRWELHRVWVVDGVLKPGERHIYQRRVYFWDEDSFAAGAVDLYGSDGSLFRAGYNHMAPHYEVPAPVGPVPFTHYDFSKGTYTVTTLVTKYGGEVHIEPKDDRWWSQQGMQQRGSR